MVHIELNSIFLESAILHYNIVVDLTWVICYISAEYAWYEKGKSTPLDQIEEIQDTRDIIRKMEDVVSNPFAKDNPLNYLKNQSPEYEYAIELVFDFWKEFSSSEVRSLYNFIKHKGKPQYSEIYNYTAKKLYSFHKEGKEYPTHENDVKREIGLYKTIDLFKDFDNDILFNYCDKLFKSLYQLVYR